MILVHVVLPIDFQIDGLAMLDAIRSKTLEKLKKAHFATALDMIFTTDVLWGAPAKQIGEKQDMLHEV